MGRLFVSSSLNGRRRLSATVLGLLLGSAWPCIAGAQAAPAQSAPAKTPPAVGTIKAISANTLTLATDAGAEIKVSLPAEVKLVRVPPGAKDMKEATPIALSDLQEGDRVVVRGKAGGDPGTFLASMVIAMKKADIAEKLAHEREEWQRHGTGGLVKRVDASAGVITIGVVGPTGSKDLAIHVSQTTIMRRYAPGSVKFEDAKKSTVAEVKAGDQVRARGTRSADGTEFAADEIVSGAFRNIAGPIVAVDTKEGTVTVADLATRKSVEIKIIPDSQLRKVPAPMAQRIALFLKGVTPEASAEAGSTAPPGGATPGPGARATTGGPNGMGGPPRNGGGDFQQMLSRLPLTPLTDFQKGDVVMIVAQGADEDSLSTAITVLGGVEPILQASTQGQAASILTPWSLNSGGGDSGTP